MASSISIFVGAPKDVPFSEIFFMESMTSGCACPKIRGPHEDTKSKNLFPSSSKMYCPSPLFIKGGTPPTDLNALTGEFTPPGMYF